MQKDNQQFRETNIKKYGSYDKYREHMREIASKGGKASGTGGFYARPDLASKYGKLGGRPSQGEVTSIIATVEQTRDEFYAEQDKDVSKA